MKLWAVSTICLVYSANAHTIFQRLKVNGVDQGQLVAIRVPNSNFPVMSTSDPNIACNSGFVTPISTTVVNVPAGAQVGAWWQHIIGGPQGTNDADNPIAASHKGPSIAYLAKVPNAATSGTSGLKWLKISQDGLDSSGKWGVDRMVANNGWAYFTIPSCMAPGNYLLRAELIALHSAKNSGQAQFYMGCAQININGSGNATGTDFVSFPGAYAASDPGILINIYDNKGTPNGGGRPYTIPGGPVFTCPAGSGGGSTEAPITDVPAPTTAAPIPEPSAGTVPLYGQCGGANYSGDTSCAQGTCKATNEYYSQCIP